MIFLDRGYNKTMYSFRTPVEQLLTNFLEMPQYLDILAKVLKKSSLAFSHVFKHTWGLCRKTGIGQMLIIELTFFFLLIVTITALL